MPIIICSVYGSVFAEESFQLVNQISIIVVVHQVSMPIIFCSVYCSVFADGTIRRELRYSDLLPDMSTLAIPIISSVFNHFVAVLFCLLFHVIHLSRLLMATTEKLDPLSYSRHCTAISTFDM